MARRSKRPRPQALPGMEDRKIAPLEKLVLDKRDLKQQRAQLLREEARIERQVLAVMEQLGKDHYAHDGIDIKVVGDKAVRIRFHQLRERKSKRRPEEP